MSKKSSTEWDVERYRHPWDSDEQWEMRRKFIHTHKKSIPEKRLVCLAQVYANIQILGCKYPNSVMGEVNELAKAVPDNKYEERLNINREKKHFVKAKSSGGNFSNVNPKQGGSQPAQPEPKRKTTESATEAGRDAKKAKEERTEPNSDTAYGYYTSGYKSQMVSEGPGVTATLDETDRLGSNDMTLALVRRLEERVRMLEKEIAQSNRNIPSENAPNPHENADSEMENRKLAWAGTLLKAFFVDGLRVRSHMDKALEKARLSASVKYTCSEPDSKIWSCDLHIGEKQFSEGTGTSQQAAKINAYTCAITKLVKMAGTGFILPPNFNMCGLKDVDTTRLSERKRFKRAGKMLTALATISGNIIQVTSEVLAKLNLKVQIVMEKEGKFFTCQLNVEENMCIVAQACTTQAAVVKAFKLLKTRLVATVMEISPPLSSRASPQPPECNEAVPHDSKVNESSSNSPDSVKNVLEVQKTSSSLQQPPETDDSPHVPEVKTCMPEPTLVSPDIPASSKKKSEIPENEYDANEMLALIGASLKSLKPTKKNLVKSVNKAVQKHGLQIRLDSKRGHRTSTCILSIGNILSTKGVSRKKSDKEATMLAVRRLKNQLIRRARQERITEEKPKTEAEKTKKSKKSRRREKKRRDKELALGKMTSDVVEKKSDILATPATVPLSEEQEEECPKQILDENAHLLEVGTAMEMMKTNCKNIIERMTAALTASNLKFSVKFKRFKTKDGCKAILSIGDNVCKVGVSKTFSKNKAKVKAFRLAKKYLIALARGSTLENGDGERCNGKERKDKVTKVGQLNKEERKEVTITKNCFATPATSDKKMYLLEARINSPKIRAQLPHPNIKSLPDFKFELPVEPNVEVVDLVSDTDSLNMENTGDESERLLQVGRCLAKRKTNASNIFRIMRETLKQHNFVLHLTTQKLKRFSKAVVCIGQNFSTIGKDDPQRIQKATVKALKRAKNALVQRAVEKDSELSATHSSKDVPGSSCAVTKTTPPISEFVISANTNLLLNGPIPQLLERPSGFPQCPVPSSSNQKPPIPLHPAQFLIIERPNCSETEIFYHSIQFCHAPVSIEYVDVSPGLIRCEVHVCNRKIAEITTPTTATRKQLKAETEIKAMEVLRSMAYTVKLKPMDERVGLEVTRDMLNEIDGAQSGFVLSSSQERAIGEHNVGNRLLRLMGWHGGGLGKEGHKGIEEPIKTYQVRASRHGLGAVSRNIPEHNDLRSLEMILQEYAQSSETFRIQLSTEFTKEERAQIHSMATKLNLVSKSCGNSNLRYLTIRKPCVIQGRTNMDIISTRCSEYDVFPPKSIR